VSGCRGIARLVVPLIDADLGQPPGRYTVKLGFASEPGETKGRSVFDVTIQGEAVLRRFDIVKAAGGSGRAVTRTFEGVAVKDTLTVAFTPSGKGGAGSKPPRIDWIEILREDVENLPLQAQEKDGKEGPGAGTKAGSGTKDGAQALLAGGTGPRS